MTTPIVFIDTETDGVHPGRRVWEVGMIRRDDAGERETSFFVHIDLRTADPVGLRVGGFYDRHPFGRRLSGQIPDGPKEPRLCTPRDIAEPKSAISTADAAHRVAQWTHGAHLVGAVPNFDAEVLANLLRANSLIPAWHYHLIDVEAMAVGWLAARQPDNLWSAPPWKSDELVKAVEVLHPDPDLRIAGSDEEKHTALGDARWAKRWYDAMTGGIR